VIYLLVAAGVVVVVLAALLGLARVEVERMRRAADARIAELAAEKRRIERGQGITAIREIIAANERAAAAEAARPNRKQRRRAKR